VREIRNACEILGGNPEENLFGYRGLDSRIILKLFLNSERL
jgi:hypothetical protein